uniref:SFRICE_026341 n=1 Tax=Spodoptera frugiperda TaxID=7108 RepID=A0A2H1W885_SPOFR
MEDAPQYALFKTDSFDCTVGAVAWQSTAAQRVTTFRFPHEATLCVIRKLLFRVWVSCVYKLLDSNFFFGLLLSENT